MTLDHIGIVTSALQPAVQLWTTLFGFRPVSPIVTNRRQRVRVIFLAGGDHALVKLMEPDGVDSPISAYAARGGGLHHLCFRCARMEDALSILRGAGARLLVPPQPGEAFCNHPIAFLMAPGNLHIELIDTPEKTRIDSSTL